MLLEQLALYAILIIAVAVFIYVVRNLDFSSDDNGNGGLGELLRIFLMLAIFHHLLHHDDNGGGF